MAVKFVCDFTGQEVVINPPATVRVDKDKKPISKKVKQQNPHTGRIQEIDTYEMDYKYPKGHYIRVNDGETEYQYVVNDETLTKLKPKLAALIKELESLRLK